MKKNKTVKNQKITNKQLLRYIIDPNFDCEINIDFFYFFLLLFSWVLNFFFLKRRYQIKKFQAEFENHYGLRESSNSVMNWEGPFS